MEKYTGIVKLEENGKVRLVDELGNPGPSLEGPFIMSITKDRLKIQVREQNHANHYIVHADVEYTQVEPAASVPFDPNTQTIEELFDLLDRNFFFDIADSGGGAVTGAESGTFISGGKVRLGGPLLQNTIITEDGFDFLADREETPPFGYGPNTTYYETKLEDIFGDGFVGNTRKLGTTVNIPAQIDETAELGVTNDSYYGAAVYFKSNDNLNNESTFGFLRKGTVSLSSRTSGIIDILATINNSFFSAQGGASSLVVNKNGNIVLQVGSAQIVFTGAIVENKIFSVGINYNILTNDHTIIATAGGVTFTLPSATIGQVFEIYPNGNAITLSAGAGRTINGAASLALSGQGGTKVKYISANNYQTI